MSTENLIERARSPSGEWIPAAAAAADDALSPEVALGRDYAVNNPRALFEPQLGLRSVQKLASNTRRGYAADWEAFVECCRRHGFRPAPASAAAVETFIEWRSPEPPPETKEGEKPKFYKYVKPGMARQPLSAWSLRRALAAIGAVHRWLKYADPTRDQDVKDTLKINVAGRQVQSHKDPLRWEHLERAFAQMGEDLWGLRDKALASVGHSTMFRRSELVALTVEDYRRERGQAFGRMVVRNTKTEDPKDLKFRHVAPEAVRYLEAWLKAANITRGPLFRGITPNRVVMETALGAGEVARTLKIIARLAGIQDVSRIAGHSTRIGATHDLKLFGADTLDIMQDGGWKSPMMPKRYLQGLESDRGAMARMSAARDGVPHRPRRAGTP